MKERPIIFTSEMVRAILKGIKTQTRRVIKPQPDKDTYEIVPSTLPHLGDLWDWHRKDGKIPLNPVACRCLYGLSGDRLWVRESFYTDGSLQAEHHISKLLYKAEEIDKLAVDYCKMKFKPALFMPRWASRITLKITNIRVERLQEISPEECNKEGIEGILSAKDSFFDLWNSINKTHPWETNPWVWVISFKRVNSH